MAPNTMVSFKKKTNETIPRKLMEDGRTDRRTHGRMGRIYFIGPFQPRPGVQKDEYKCKTVHYKCQIF